MAFAVRPASSGDHARLEVISREGDSLDATSSYLSFVARVGRLLAAYDEARPTDPAGIVGFGGAVPVGDVAMVTDLFVTEAARGRGVGGLLLGRLVAGSFGAMTFSSQHPAASRVYRRAGLAPRWRLLYLSGRAHGGGTPLVPGLWPHDRTDLVSHFSTDGALVTSTCVVRHDADVTIVQRLNSGTWWSALRSLLAALPAGRRVEICVPEPHPSSGWLLDRGFVVAGYDTFHATPGIDLPPDLCAVHPGLC